MLGEWKVSIDSFALLHSAISKSIDVSTKNLEDVREDYAMLRKDTGHLVMQQSSTIATLSADLPK